MNELDHWRNRIAVPVCNWVLNHVATEGYRVRVELLMRLGMADAYGKEALRAILPYPGLPVPMPPPSSGSEDMGRHSGPESREL